MDNNLVATKITLTCIISVTTTVKRSDNNRFNMEFPSLKNWGLDGIGWDWISRWGEVKNIYGANNLV